MKRREMLRRVLGAVALAYGVSRGPRVVEERGPFVHVDCVSRPVLVTGRNALGEIVTEVVDVGEPLPPLERVLTMDGEDASLWRQGYVLNVAEAEQWRRVHVSSRGERSARGGWPSPRGSFAGG